MKKEVFILRMPIIPLNRSCQSLLMHCSDSYAGNQPRDTYCSTKTAESRVRPLTVPGERARYGKRAEAKENNDPLAA